MGLLKEDIQPRDYQKNIAKNASKKNTLVVLPTGLGKTLISVLVSIERLEKFPDSKVLITAPTRPLNAQHKKSFEKVTNMDPDKIVLITGKIKPEDRAILYKNATVVIATPQTIENDLENGKINLKNFSFVTFDEAHRSMKEYSYTYIAKKYKEQAEHLLIMGLTASPGGTEEKIKDITKNLFIENVEIRTEEEEDVKQYVKEIVKDWIYVDFPEEFQMIKGFLEEVLKENIYWLKEHHFTSSYKPNKTQLLMLQKSIGAKYSFGKKNYSLLFPMLRVAESIKLIHAIELLETQGISSLYEYMKKLEMSKKNIDRKISKDPRTREAMKRVENLYSQGVNHPKLVKLKEIILGLVKENPRIKIIVFANYRTTVDKINKMILDAGIKSDILIGQTIKAGRGMSQDQQIETLKRFGEGEFNVLVGSSISEEGLDVPSVDYAIFYEPVASEIRTIQRRGRIGRQTTGKLIFLITKDTRDEAYYYSALHKEKKMKGILYG